MWPHECRSGAGAPGRGRISRGCRSRLTSRPGSRRPRIDHFIGSQGSRRPPRGRFRSLQVLGEPQTESNVTKEVLGEPRTEINITTKFSENRKERATSQKKFSENRKERATSQKKFSENRESSTGHVFRFSENRDVMFASLYGSPRTCIACERAREVLRELIHRARTPQRFSENRAGRAGLSRQVAMSLYQSARAGGVRVDPGEPAAWRPRHCGCAPRCGSAWRRARMAGHRAVESRASRSTRRDPS
jgi:hypothetical protein